MDIYFIQQVVNALSAGSLYALMAVGLALIFGILRLINFAHGDVMMVGAYLAAFSLFAGLPFPVAIVTMVGGMVTCAVKYAKFEALPEKVEAGEQKNVQQDAQLNELKVINDTWQKIYQQQKQQAPSTPRAPAVPQPPSIWIEPELVEDRWVCTDGVQRWWFDQEKGCD